MKLASALAPVIDFVFPPRCPLCGRGIGAQTGLCVDCWSTLDVPGEPACARCGRPFVDAVVTGIICGPCLAEPPRHDGIAAATLYNEASRKLVLAFKHGRRLALAPLMARLIHAQLPQIDGEWLLVPVPLHRLRLWSRGYNQAAVLAGELARLSKATLAVDALHRHKRTASLGALGRKARRRELSGAIRMSAKGAAIVRGRKVVLVDDVLTSGATSDACVRVLKRAGAERVVVACFARVVDEATGQSATKNARGEPRASS
jgi:ComF family protein